MEMDSILSGGEATYIRLVCKSTNHSTSMVLHMKDEIMAVLSAKVPTGKVEMKGRDTA